VVKCGSNNGHNKGTNINWIVLFAQI